MSDSVIVKKRHSLRAALGMTGAALVVAAFLFYSVRIAKVTGEQVGVKLSKITGKVTVVTQSGAIIYNGIANYFGVGVITMDACGASIFFETVIINPIA